MAISTNKPSFLIPLLVFVPMFFIMFPSKVNSAESLSFNFTKFDPDQKDLIFQGDATSTNNVLQLTKLDSGGNPVGASVGRVLYSAPFHLWENSMAVSSFETNLTIQISTPHPYYAADGFAFFLAPHDTVIPQNSWGKLLGLYSNVLKNSPTSENQSFGDVNTDSRAVAVEFDTFPNANIDPNYRHIGIDVNSIKSKETARWEWQNGKTATARINYNSASKKLTVTTFYPGMEVVTLSHDVDLHAELPEWVRVGLSASTGEEKQKNTIISWSFTSSLKNNEVKEPKEDMYIANVV